MSVQRHRIVSGAESEIHDEPHLEGHRITVRQIVECVEGRGLDPGAVADRHNLPVADIYRALIMITLTVYRRSPPPLTAIGGKRRE